MTKWRNYWLILILLISLSASTTSVFARASDTDRQANNLILVQLHNSEDISAINRRYRTITIDDSLSQVDIYLIQPTQRSVRWTINRLRSDSRVKLVEYNKSEPLVDELIYADPSHAWAWGGYESHPINSQMASQILSVYTAQTMSVGEGVTVAVLDTGVQLDHPYLSSVLVDGYDFVDNDNHPDDELPLDRSTELTASGHGTHVAGLIHYVAPKAKIMPLRVLETNGGGDLFTIMAGVVFAIHNGADIINMSLGTTLNSEMLQSILLFADAEGIIIVAAAGNNADSEPQYPAAYNHVIGVASITEEYKVSDFSNFGEWVDIVAPGESAFSSFPTDGYAWWTGTSMATGLVSGQLALIESVAPNLDMDDFLEEIAQSVEQQNPGFDDKLGFGYIDSAEALQYLGIAPTFRSD